MKNNYRFLVFLALLLPMVLSATPVQVEAEDYAAMQGIELENGGTNIGYFDDGDWLQYTAISFDGGYNSITFQTAKGNNGGSVEIRLDALNGPIIGTFYPQNTLDWTVFEAQLTGIDAVTGTHDLFLVGRGVTGVCNLDFFVLSEEEIYEPNWVLDWADEFNGNAVDENYWSKVHHGNPDNGELQFYTPRPENIVVSDGTLKLIARQETYTGQGPAMNAPATRNYTSGKIETLGKITFQYGKIEASMKLPRGPGTWPAFWMLGENIFEPGIGWPRCGEIDIMEHGQDFNNLGAAIHTQAYNHTIGTQITGTYQIDDYDTGFHTYGLVWDTEEMSFSVDGETYMRVKKSSIGDSEAQWPFDQPFFIILNHAVGGAWGGTPDNSLYPHTVEVDWVRVYKDEQPTSTAVLEETPSLSVYPNPTSGLVQITIGENPTAVTVSLNDITGRELATKKAESEQLTFDLAGLPSGVYFVTVYEQGTGRLLQSCKVVKEY
ncbi:family 16 glycosylhydrolase [Lewinella sp. LCG006]|uniref:carbohydrate-binding protein n=1 Tax=Lewinella sp. LCG006 TaxID=3231911 RepID=UPI00345FF2BC